MSNSFWPHQFTKDGKEIQIGVRDDGTGEKIMTAPMICVHCAVKWLNGKESRPPDPCPARNDRREMKRIKR